MLGVEGRLEGDSRRRRIKPADRCTSGAGRIDVVSMGFLVDAEETALMWRGLILQRAVQHFLEDVAWADDLDYLLIDMPPGTGDVQMGLAKLLPRAEMIVVTTPSRSAQKVAVRAVNMGRQNYLRIVGVIENMSEFVAPDGERTTDLRDRRRRRPRRRGRGPAARLASRSSPPWPRAATPARRSRSATAPRPTRSATWPDRIVDEVAPPTDMAGCSARLLDAVNAALAAHDAGA